MDKVIKSKQIPKSLKPVDPTSDDRFKALGYPFENRLLTCWPTQWQLHKFDIHIQKLPVALLTDTMTTYKFRYTHSKTACWPVDRHDDDLNFLLFWHTRSKGACCPVDRHHDKLPILAYTFENSLLTCWPTRWRLNFFVILAYMFKRCLLPCWPTPWQITNFGIHILKQPVDLLTNTMMT